VCDRPDVPSGLGPVLVEELESGKSKNAIEQVVVGEAKADNIVL
jgi:hypothetical protein